MEDVVTEIMLNAICQGEVNGFPKEGRTHAHRRHRLSSRLSRYKDW